MSELQFGLIVIGVLVVVGVYAFNRYQERQFRRRMESKFQERPDDVLMKSDPVHEAPEEPEERIEPHVGPAASEAAATASAETVAPAPASSVAAPTEAVMAQEPAAAPAVVRAAAAAAAAEVVIDYVCLVETAEPIPHAALTAFIKSAGMIGKPVIMVGWSIRSNEWVELPCAPEIPLVRVQAALQLADRSGAVNRVQLSTMRDLVHQFAAQVGVSCECPDIDAAAHAATDLDRFCAQVDVSIGCNVLPSGSGGLSGTKVRGLLESAGFTLEASGRFLLRADDGSGLISVESVDGEPLSAERLRGAPLGGLTLNMDVPKVASGVRAFDRLMELGRHLAQSLDASIVDDNRAPLTDAGIKVIRQQVRNVHAAMEAHGIPAGSALAGRLFS
jgi:FtsZ-interacting cell division protein ZipA